LKCIRTLLLSFLSLLPKKGHWPQLDGAPEVAQLLLSLPEASPA